jgi:hypothetical protein
LQSPLSQPPKLLGYRHEPPAPSSHLFLVACIWIITMVSGKGKM